MSDTQPTVSVIIPTYNRADRVTRAIDSALAQTVPPMEVIVIDDGSTDNTQEVLAAYGDRIHVVYQANAGVSAARNTGLELATGELIALLDSDDIWLPHKLELQLQVFALDEDLDRAIVLVHSNARSFYPDGSTHSDDFAYHLVPPFYDPDGRNDVVLDTELGPNPDTADKSIPIQVADISKALFFGGQMLNSSVVLRRSAMEKTHGFDGSMNNAAEEYELFTRVCEFGFSARMMTITTLYATGGDDHLRHNTVAMASSMLEILRRVEERHDLEAHYSATDIAAHWQNWRRWQGAVLMQTGDGKGARAALWHAFQDGRKVGITNLTCLIYWLVAWLPVPLINSLKKLRGGDREI